MISPANPHGSRPGTGAPHFPFSPRCPCPIIRIGTVLFQCLFGFRPSPPEGLFLVCFTLRKSRATLHIEHFILWLSPVRVSYLLSRTGSFLRMHLGPSASACIQLAFRRGISFRLQALTSSRPCPREARTAGAVRRCTCSERRSSGMFPLCRTRKRSQDSRD